MAERDAQLRFGDFVIDPMARSVSFGSDEIALTRREFDILFTLASHPGWVYSSETLATNDPSAYASPSSVNVHVSRLRGKEGRQECRPSSLRDLRRWTRLVARCMTKVLLR